MEKFKPGDRVVFWGNHRGTVKEFLPWYLYLVTPDYEEDRPFGDFSLAESALRPLDLIERVGELNE